MCSRDLSDMSTLALGCCTPLCLCLHIRQITPDHVTYIACIINTSSIWSLCNEETACASTFKPICVYYNDLRTYIQVHSTGRKFVGDVTKPVLKLTLMHFSYYSDNFQIICCL